MYGSATLAMLVSSTSMNAASATTTAMSQGLCRGRPTALAAGARELGNFWQILWAGGGVRHRAARRWPDLPDLDLRHHRHAGADPRFGSGASSMTILTGTRCTTLT